MGGGEIPTGLGWRNYAYHYKWNGTNWTSVSTLTTNEFAETCAVIYNNEIHLLGGFNGSNAQSLHHKFNGTKWVSVSTLPRTARNGYAGFVVFNNEIHMFGGEDTSSTPTNTVHYKYNGSSWTSLSDTLPMGYRGSSTVLYKNEIHLLGSSITSYFTSHYKFNGSSWVSVSTLPISRAQSGYTVFLVYNDEIHLLGGYASSEYLVHYSFNGSAWTKQNDITLRVNTTVPKVIFNNEPHFLGVYGDGNLHAKMVDVYTKE